jgi:hypothetical protein
MEIFFIEGFLEDESRPRCQGLRRTLKSFCDISMTPMLRGESACRDVSFHDLSSIRHKALGGHGLPSELLPD